jgi:hypothetical protein
MQITPSSPLARVGRVLKLTLLVVLLSFIFGIGHAFMLGALRPTAKAASGTEKALDAALKNLTGTPVDKLTDLVRHETIRFRLAGADDSVAEAVRMLTAANRPFIAMHVKDSIHGGKDVSMYAEKERIEREMLSFVMDLQEAIKEKKLSIMMVEVARATDPLDFSPIMEVTGKPTDAGGQMVWR